jgi:hypothetical protein
MSMNTTALLCTAVLGLLLFSLGLAISGLRFRSGTLSGHAASPDDLLAKLVRAHGNTAEYVPLLAVLFLYLGAHHPAQWQVWSMVGATASRVLLAVGLLAWPTMARPNPARFAGAIGTYLFGAALCVALLNGA